MIQDIKDFWSLIADDKFAKYFFVIILGQIIILILYIIFNDKKVGKSSPITRADTTINKQDTFFKVTNKEKQKETKKEIKILNPQRAEEKNTNNQKPNIEGKNIFKGGTGNTYRDQIHVGDVYNKPARRTVTDEDISRIINLASSKDELIKVYSNGSIEGNKFRDEIVEGLRNKGHFVLTLGQIGMSENTWNEERLSVKKKDGFVSRGERGVYIEVLVNPQE